jgi:hypothetical protein
LVKILKVAEKRTKRINIVEKKNLSLLLNLKKLKNLIMLELSYVSTSRIVEIKGMIAPMLRISKNEESVIAKAMKTKVNFFFLSKNRNVRNNS